MRLHSATAASHGRSLSAALALCVLLAFAALAPEARAQTPTVDAIAITGTPSTEFFKDIRIIATGGEDPNGAMQMDAQHPTLGSIPMGGPVSCLVVGPGYGIINFEDQSSGLGIVTVGIINGLPDRLDAALLQREPTDCSPPDLPFYPDSSAVAGGDIILYDAPPKLAGVKQPAFTGQRAAALRKCRGKKRKALQKCRKKASRIPV